MHHPLLWSFVAKGRGGRIIDGKYTVGRTVTVINLFCGFQSVSIRENKISHYTRVKQFSQFTKNYFAKYSHNTSNKIFNHETLICKIFT